MTLYELMDLAQSISSRIDVQWGFFITIHLALLGGIIYVDRPLKKAEKLIGFAVYLLFAIFNFRVITTHQGLLEKIYTEIAGIPEVEGTGSGLVSHYQAAMTTGYADDIYLITLSVHLVSFLVVLVSFITDGPRKQ
ncbi:MULTISPECIES: hypothetical protein [Kordiimonas]|uniref:hypothetical protein n=1 Tax=Kordiimonas TaxID=288021 RepID=UPI00257E8D21|nr:hypothetical protein [Kordiimonas sp. UBA4487]